MNEKKYLILYFHIIKRKLFFLSYYRSAITIIIIIMDVILKFYDDKILTPFIYPSNWYEDYWLRQLLSLFVIVSTHSVLLYLILSGTVFYFIFDKNLMNHPKFLKVYLIFFFITYFHSEILFV
jgi:hypothetical protein